MKAESRHLFGEEYKGYEITIPADAKNGDAKLLEEAARICRKEEVAGVVLNGVSWRESDNHLVLALIVTPC